MPGPGFTFALLTVFGGITLFMFGMHLITTAIQRVAGKELRELLYRVTAHRTIGLLVGTIVATLMHSVGTIVMVIGFLNAGLVTLAQAVAVILGANVGTTLAMQIVAFQIGKYCYLAVGAGFLIFLFSNRYSLKYFGYGLLGFGLIFLGMETMSAGLMPLQKQGVFASVLSVIDPATTGGFLLSLFIGIVISAIVQSGATIGLLFALSIAGAFRGFGDVFPIILGAHIGTCAPVLIGCIGSNRTAKRAAWVHVLFNVTGAALAIGMIPIYYRMIPATSDDLPRQIANAHTLIQVVNALIFLPFCYPFARLVGTILPKAKSEESTFLSAQYLDTPEMAIVATIKEIRRMAVYTVRMLRIAMEGMVRMDLGRYYQVAIYEDIVDSLKNAINAYLIQLSERKLSRRQSVLMQYLMSTVADLERIGDHIDTMVSMTKERFHRDIWFDWDSMQEILNLYQYAHKVLSMVVRSLDPKQQNFSQHAERIMELRDAYVKVSSDVKSKYQQLIFAQKADAISWIYYWGYINCFDKIVKHSKLVARTELQPLFFLKEHKLDRKSDRIEMRPVKRPERNGDLPPVEDLPGLSDDEI